MASNQYIKIGILTFFIIFFVSSVFAFGAGSKYSKNYPLAISPGDTEDIKVVLKAEGDTNVVAKIVKGEEIAKITDSSKEYFIPAGGGTPVNIRVKIPRSFDPQNYTLEISFISTDEGGEGTVSLRTGVRKKIPIVIRPSLSPEEEFIPWPSLGIALGIILLIVIIIILKHKRKR